MVWTALARGLPAVESAGTALEAGGPNLAREDRWPGARRRRAIARTALVYGLMLVLAVVAFLAIDRYGSTLAAPQAGRSLPAGRAEGQPDVLLHVLVALAAVIGAGHLLAKLIARLGQPPVIGEVVAGILLGPSLLGQELSAWVIPPSVAPVLGPIAQLGVILYMFVVGPGLSGTQLRHRLPSTVAISHTGILLPFLLDAALALWLCPRFSSADVPFTTFALFLGVAMSITTFPVLARILTDRGLARTELGVVALGCAATEDLTAWCLLAFVVGIARAQAGAGLLVAAGALAFVAVMFLAVRRLLVRVISRWTDDRLPKGAVVFVFVALLLSAATTE